MTITIMLTMITILILNFRPGYPASGRLESSESPPLLPLCKPLSPPPHCGSMRQRASLPPLPSPFTPRVSRPFFFVWAGKFKIGERRIALDNIQFPTLLLEPVLKACELPH